MNEVFFYLFGALSVVLAAVSVISKNVVRGGVALLGCFVSLGALYLSVGAEFIGIVQVIVYAGAIVVLYLFALMTMDLSKMEREPFRIGSFLAGGVLSTLLAISFILAGFKLFGEVKVQISGAKELAEPLFFKYLLPFEIVSVLLLVATIGAVAVGRRDG